MLFKIDDKQCRIMFFKCPDTRTVKMKGGGKKRVGIFNTRCNIYIGDDLVGTGFAEHNPIDQYDKVTGKKYALLRALKFSKSKVERLNVDYEHLRHLSWHFFVQNFTHIIIRRFLQDVKC